MKRAREFLFEIPKKEFVSVHREAMKDARFKKFWKKEKMIRVLQEKRCRYCGIEFRGDKGAVLHHTKISDKAEELDDFDKLMNYYKSLKDTDLICLSCHAKEHYNVVSKGKRRQRRLF